MNELQQIIGINDNRFEIKLFCVQNKREETETEQHNICTLESSATIHL